MGGKVDASTREPETEIDMNSLRSPARLTRGDADRVRAHNEELSFKRTNGHSRRSKGRTVQLGHKITPEAHRNLIMLADLWGAGIAETIEEAIELCLQGEKSGKYER